MGFRNRRIHREAGFGFWRWVAMIRQDRVISLSSVSGRSIAAVAAARDVRPSFIRRAVLTRVRVEDTSGRLLASKLANGIGKQPSRMPRALVDARFLHHDLDYPDTG